MIMWLVKKGMKDPLDLQDQKVNVACLVSGISKLQSCSKNSPLKELIADYIFGNLLPLQEYFLDSHVIADLKCILRLIFNIIYP